MKLNCHSVNVLRKVIDTEKLIYNPVEHLQLSFFVNITNDFCEKHLISHMLK